MIRKFFLALFLLTLFSFLTFAQKPKPKPRPTKTPFAAKPTIDPAKEKGELDKALAETDLTSKIAALQKFAADYPKSTERNRVLEIMVSARASLADEKLRAEDNAAGIELFKQAVIEAPTPISDKLFSEVILHFPTNLFYRNQQAAAIEIARLIEEKTSDNPKQLLSLATFYLGTENAGEARRIADKAIEIDATLPIAYQTLGMANRLGFQLEDSANAYAKALELDPNSVVSKRSLAEMKRATGKTDEAITLYREILEKDPEDSSAQTGLVLSLFNAEKVSDAETELAKALEKNPNNLFLLVGTAYWYAAHRQGDKAVEYARKAVALEPRYTWAHIALARGFLVQGLPLEAERELLAARPYGNFPTLDYEIASARLAAGLYEEASRELKKNFAIKEDTIETRLGNRVSKQAKNFTELIELERRASIFEPLAADSPENAEKLKSLLRLNQTLSSEEAKEDEITQAVTEFVNGDDKAKIHRQLYVANRLLLAKKNLPKVLELTQAAVSGVDSALEIPSPAAAVMAEELFESRNIAMSKNEVVVIPDIPRQTLSAILRGRIEEIAGWTLYQQDKPQEAVVRLKRAVSILPEKSAWWRSSTWKLGAALDAAGKQPEALDMYIKNYLSSDPDMVKRSVIETLYQKVNGNLDGLDSKIGAKRPEPVRTAPSTETVAQNTVTAKPESTPTPSIEVSATPETSPTPEVSNSPKPETSPTPIETVPQVENKSETKPEETTTAKVESSPTPEPTPETKPTPEQITEVKAEPTPSVSPTLEIKTENSETKPAETAEKTNSAPETKPTPKPLFDPIIITVPKPETSKTLKTSPIDEKSTQVAKLEESKTENKSSELPDVLKSTTPVDGSGEIRPRLIPPNPSTGNAQTENADCQLTVNQESVTILSQGGNLGILLGFQGEGGDITKVTATSNSPGDVEVSLEPDIGKQSNRAFFIIKSVSANKGIYSVIFDSPCGKKEVLVKVR